MDFDVAQSFEKGDVVYPTKPGRPIERKSSLK